MALSRWRQHYYRRVLRDGIINLYAARALATGPVRNALTGRFERNIYGAVSQRVKGQLSLVGTGKLADYAGNAIRCEVK